MNEMELLFSEVLQCERIALYSRPEPVLTEEQARFISQALARRSKGEPLQYILGKQEFMGLEFKVTPDVLIPRPETEILVECVLEELKKRGSNNLRLLDMFCGSGCIAVSLAHLVPGLRVSASDISPEALEIARFNAASNGAEVDFYESDLFSRIPQSFDIITANAPYVATGDIKLLAPEISYEPHQALDGGSDGLKFFRKLSAEAAGHLNEGGLLFLEIGSGQAGEVKNIFQNSGDFEIIDFKQDYCAIERVCILQRKAKQSHG